MLRYIFAARSLVVLPYRNPLLCKYVEYTKLDEELKRTLEVKKWKGMSKFLKGFYGISKER